MTVKELTRIAVMASILYVVFDVFSNILYLEMITFTIVAFGMHFSRREVVYACMMFAFIQILFHGLMVWNIMYLVIYPSYGFLVSVLKKKLEKNVIGVSICIGVLSFFTGPLVELPFLCVSKTVTLVYVLMGLKTSFVQGCIAFMEGLFLYEPVCHILKKIGRE